MTTDLDLMFRDNYRCVYRAAYGVTGRPEDAEDVLQNLFLRLLQRGFPPDVRRNSRGYLYRAAINLALDSVPSRRRQLMRETLARMESAAATRNCDSDEAVEASLHKAVGELDPESAELLLSPQRKQTQRCRDRKNTRNFAGSDCCQTFRTRTRIRKLMRTHDETLQLACDKLLEHRIVDKTKVLVTTYAQGNHEGDRFIYRFPKSRRHFEN